jgi:hypothetical protein
MSTLTFDGVSYVVLTEKTYEHNGSKRASITMKRPRGKRTYHVVRYENGTYSSITPLR